MKGKSREHRTAQAGLYSILIADDVVSIYAPLCLKPIINSSYQLRWWNWVDTVIFMDVIVECVCNV
jgi:hypothetical protein